MSRLTLHHLNNSRSQRVLWLLEELGRPYELVCHQRVDGGLAAPPELQTLHPLGKAPVLVVDGHGTLHESGAIVEYLLDGPGGDAFRPTPGTVAHQRMREWLHFAEGSAMTPLLLHLTAEAIRQAPMPALARGIARQIADGVARDGVTADLNRHLGHVEQTLSGGPWLLGDALTGADVMMSFPLQMTQALGLLPAAHAQTAAWLARIVERPAWQRAVERGGAYELKL